MYMVTKLQNSNILAVSVISFAVLVGVLAAWVSPEIERSRTIEWLEQPRPVAAFSLQSATRPFTRQNFEGNWHLLVFGYTSCPDICPTALVELKTLMIVLEDELDDDIRNWAGLQIVFVSVDPGRDKPAMLSEYVGYFNPGFVGVTGSTAQLELLANSLGVRFKLSATDDDYRISHSTSLSLIGPDGMLQGRLRPGFDIASAARELANRWRDSS